ncbi:PC-esterase domain-containing protein 1A-like isoform X2 [Engraulis encrasicolus]|uniref:PC-esterase domain-containing protein 1A-like isoform X2 n=1 Tax=Engraulis encrasicolus TaxID=184585 RepID=UPI002FD418DD
MKPTVHFNHQQAKDLLHNKYVVVLGDSIQRGVYKDIVLLLQKDVYLTSAQLKTKGEEVFENDRLLEGGRLGRMSNGTEYREVREYSSDHHCVRFYFITRVFSDYVESIFEEIREGMKPDLVIVNSCVWDVSRYGRVWEADYMENLTSFFRNLRLILPDDSLIIWNVTMPLGEKIIGGFLVPEIAEIGPMLRFDIVEANYCSATLANTYGLDVLDLHFQFRFNLQHRMKDGVHWNAVAHRRITCLLLAHVAQAWGVELLPSQPPTGLNTSFSETAPQGIKTIQPRKAQKQASSWRSNQRWANYYPPPPPPPHWLPPPPPRYFAGSHNGSWDRVSYSTQGPLPGWERPWRPPMMCHSGPYYANYQDFSSDAATWDAQYYEPQSFHINGVPTPPRYTHGGQVGPRARRKKYSKNQYRPY